MPGLWTRKRRGAGAGAPDSDGSTDGHSEYSKPDPTKVTTTPSTAPDLEITLQRHHRITRMLLGSKPEPIPKERPETTKLKANPVSRLMWTWLGPLIRTGFNRVLEINDIPRVPESERNEIRMGVYRDKLAEYSKAAERVPYRELRAAAYAMRWRFVVCAITAALFVATELSVTVVSRKLISEVSLLYYGQKKSHGHAVAIAVGSTLMSLFFQILLTWMQYTSRYFSELVRTMVISAIFDKVTRLSPLGRQQFPPSKITAIITTDTNRLFMAARWTPFLVVFVPTFGAMIGLLYSYIGVACLPGCGLVLIGLMLNLTLSRLITRLRRLSIPYADRRIATVRETVENMRIIKFYGWEISFVDLISRARNKEANLLKMLALVEGLTDAMTTSMPFFAGLLAFAVRTILGKGLNPALVFPALTVFQLYIPMTMMFTAGVNTHADAWASIKRLDEFFRADEAPNYVLEAAASAPSAVVIDGASFKWDAYVADTPTDRKRQQRLRHRVRRLLRRQQDADVGAELQPEPAESLVDAIEYAEKKASLEEQRDLGRAGALKFPGLQGIDLDIKRGELVMVVGTIGSGKTSLLSSIVGNITKLSGSVTVAGKVSTVLSTWSQNDTIRNNILFGKPYDEAKYAEVVKVCSLEADFANFQSRDFVEVGERGITLSGGQKARISLARCAYQGGDVILLDDVLSAVDGKVSAHIFEQCIKGYLGHATRIMSTHNLKLLPAADRVVFMDGYGHAQIGTMADLMATNETFKTMYLKGINTDEDELEAAQVHADETASGDERVARLHRENDGDDDDDDVIQRVRSRASTIKKQLSRAPAEGDGGGDGVLMTKEKRMRGQVQGKVVMEYLRKGSRIGLPFIGVIIFWQCTVATAATMQTVFLNFWSSDRYHKSNGFYIGMYALIMSIRFFSYLCLAVSVAYFCFTSSSQLHNGAVSNLYRAPISYFDTTPLGRIINRFTDDTANLDTQLYMQLRMFLFSASMLMSTIITIFVYVPYTALALVPLIILALIYLNYYRSGAREIKRINSLFRSSMFSVVTETVSGLPVIMAFGRANDYRKILDRKVDDMNWSFQLAIAAQYWMVIRVVITSATIVFITVMLCVYQVFNLPPATVGMLLSILPSVSISLSMSLPMFAELENQVNSIERLYELAHDIPQEAPYHIAETEPPAAWPQEGRIEFRDARLRYRPDLPEVLKGINLSIKGGEKVGIIGRTGAGKSTIMSALFRVTELSSGQILIDGVDTGTLGLEDLRRKLAIIPQEPVLFQGTIRFNLDPFNEHTDVELWDALRRSGVVRENEIVNGQVDSDHKFHLDTKIDADGSNLSLGERQLLTLARALVRQARVIALDEATAAVDFDTDAIIQETIAREFADCTILSIAHRLLTIINYDRVVVMDHGIVHEDGNPYELYMRADSAFRQMANDSGIRQEDFRHPDNALAAPAIAPAAALAAAPGPKGPEGPEGPRA